MPRGTSSSSRASARLLPRPGTLGTPSPSPVARRWRPARWRQRRWALLAAAAAWQISVVASVSCPRSRCGPVPTKWWASRSRRTWRAVRGVSWRATLPGQARLGSARPSFGARTSGSSSARARRSASTSSSRSSSTRAAWARRSCPLRGTPGATCSGEEVASCPADCASGPRLWTSGSPAWQVWTSARLSRSGLLLARLPASGFPWTWTAAWSGRRYPSLWRSSRLTSMHHRGSLHGRSKSATFASPCAAARGLTMPRRCAATPWSGGSRPM
mmetsp:Transcript_162947/g.522507  ORF Transcript_162947/g.522507 Transcript_162947/m.522507 type:complete len:272 (-) Transcript_162947:663-1478(-)